MMTPLELEFELEDEVDALEAAALIQERLSALDVVEAAEAQVPETRFTGIELIAGVAAAVLLVRTSRELVEESTVLLTALKGLVGQIPGLKNIRIKLGGKTVPIAEAQPAAVAAAVAGDYVPGSSD